MGFLPFETFSEFGALVQLKYFHKLPAIDKSDESLVFCYDKLNQVSRSFAMVIQELPEELKHPIAIFYLVLRGLDTVEDDIEYLKENPEAKHELLRTFYQKIRDPNFHLENCGGSLQATAHYADLMLHFDHVCKIFLRLDQKYQAVIEDVTMKMGCGMVDYLGMTGVDTVKDYDEYCHYVAGLVGIGLSDMFSAFGENREDLFKAGLSGSSEEPTKKSLSNLMGLFLQKVNIIRDYAEDIEEGRTFYPSSAFQQFGLTQVTDLKDPKNLPQALKTLNYLVTDALSHAPDCLEYMSNIKDPKVFSFCAIPQVMAIATLVEIYNNPNVFVKNVKIRKGLTARIFMETKSLGDVQKWFSKFAADLRVKLEKNLEDPSAQQTKQALDNIQKKAGEKTMKNGLKISSGFGLVSVITALVCYTLYGRSPSAASRGASIFGRLFGWTGLTPTGI
uniref:squalene synthase n=1 Tax=Naegleria gruberi TaxID=5762 RepID=E0A9E0_NAEGR|nr:squalene synthase [Naegleria gruberi]